MNGRLKKLQQETLRIQGGLTDSSVSLDKSDGATSNPISDPMSPTAASKYSRGFDDGHSGFGQTPVEMSDFYRSSQSFKTKSGRNDQDPFDNLQRAGPSLAQSLRSRREYQEIIQSERQAHGIEQKFVRKVPTAVDETGSAIRIRP